jgi:hypothetical protein
MISLLYRVAVSLSLVVVGALFYLFSHGKKLESTVSPIKGTYRVRHIPARYRTGEDSRRLIEAILSGPGQPCTIKARSFASNIDHNPTRKITTRTLTFDLDDGSPFTLQPNPENEWTFRAFDSESQENDDYLIVDTHFVGFTVLSCPEDDDHRFEYLPYARLHQRQIAKMFIALLRSLVLVAMPGAPSRKGAEHQCGWLTNCQGIGLKPES